MTDQWYAHHGEACPVNENVPVVISLRCWGRPHDSSQGFRAGAYRWAHDGGPGDIIEWRRADGQEVEGHERAEVPQLRGDREDRPELEPEGLHGLPGIREDRGEEPEAGIAAKARHVRNAEFERGHGCHWPGCPLEVKPAVWGCAHHWKMLPKHLRDMIWRTYQPGQENTKTPSREYVEAAREVRAWIDEHHPTERTLL